MALTPTSAVRSFWARHKITALHTATVVMLIAAVVWLGYEGWRLLLQQGFWGAIDLGAYHRLVQGWFAGLPVYSFERSGIHPSGIHPPATYVLVWPFLGWLSFPAARWLWAASTVAALGLLIAIIVKESRASIPLERLFVALLPLSMYATGAAIGNGQLITLLLPCIIFSLLLLWAPARSPRAELLGVLLFLFGLAKPTLSAPFFWIVLFALETIRPAILIGAGYLVLTLAAAAFQNDTVIELIRDWLASPKLVGQRGESNVHVWLTDLGLHRWRVPAALVLLLGQGLWTYRYRHAPLWTLMAVAALIARLWTYHAWYDDMLILVPMIALFRIAKEAPASDLGIRAGVLLAAGVLTALAPGGLYLFPAPWNTVYTTGQVIVWLAMLVFFVRRAAVEPAMARTAWHRHQTAT